MFISIMWLENSPEFHEKVFCIDVDLDSGRVTLYGETGLTQDFNAKLEELVMSVRDPLEGWR
jgi:hypothetical protein